MEIYFYKYFFRYKYRTILFLLLTIFILGVVYYPNDETTIPTTFRIEREKPVITETIANLSTGVDIIDLQKEIKENFNCIQTKYLLHTYRTTLCLHDKKDAMSKLIEKDKIWEEEYLIKIIEYLIQYPQMNFIDVGANIGAYTMFVASFGRQVLAIECFKPNIDRIRKAVQLENLRSEVTIIGNAIFSSSGYYLQMKSEPTNVGSQGIIVHSNMNHSQNDTYAVRTIRFDDILPILKEKNIRHAVMKVDIQWSEIYLCLSGGAVFDYVNIPVVLMEWDIGALGHYEGHMRYVLKFFLGRGYLATSDMCTVLNERDVFHSWPPNIYWMKMDRSGKFC